MYSVQQTDQSTILRKGIGSQRNLGCQGFENPDHFLMLFLTKHIDAVVDLDRLARLNVQSGATLTSVVQNAHIGSVLIRGDTYDISLSSLGNNIILPSSLFGLLCEHLLKAGEIEEGILSVEELRAADEIFLINSVRKWRGANLLECGVN